MNTIRYIVLPLTILVALLIFFMFLGYLGLSYWVDVFKGPTELDQISVPLNGIATVDIYYPEVVRLNSSAKTKLVFELTPMTPVTRRTITTTIHLKETSPHIELDRYHFDILSSSSVPQSELVEIIPRNLGSPPASVNVSVEMIVTGAQDVQEKSIRIPVDNWTWRVAAFMGICAASVSFLAAFVAIRQRRQ